MALSPSIPTSFVPKQPVQSTARAPKGGWNIFWLVAFVLVIVSLVGSGLVFGYERYLISIRDSKIAELEAAKQSISASTVEEFIRLRDRFTASQALLDRHTSFSQFLDVLEELTLQNVRFDSLSFTTDSENGSKIELTGTARTFNALAAQSNVLNEERRIKRVIFSGITVNADNTVSFLLSAELDPLLIVMKAPEASVAPQAELGEEEGVETGMPAETPQAPATTTPPTP